MFIIDLVMTLILVSCAFAGTLITFIVIRQREMLYIKFEYVVVTLIFYLFTYYAYVSRMGIFEVFGK